jgi:acyl dehydratase
MGYLENVSYEDLTIGQTAAYSKTVTERDIQLFAIVSGDANPVHLDEAYASGTSFEGRIAHGMLTGTLVSAAIATTLPGPGSVYRSQSLRFRAPVRIGDTVTVRLEVSDKNELSHLVTLDCKAYNQDDKLVASGSADVIVAPGKIRVEAPILPEVSLD